MGPSSEVRDRELHRLLAAAVQDGLTVLARYVADDRYVPSRYEHPSVRDVTRAGFPNVSYSILSSGPPDYRSLFRHDRNENWGPVAAIYDELPSWEAASEYMRNDPMINAALHWNIPDEELSRQMGRSSRMGVIESLLERCATLTGLDSWDEQVFTEAYQAIERWLLGEDLSVTVGVPVALTRFDFDTAQLVPGVTLERLDDSVTAARLRSRMDMISPVPRPVLESASHALLISGVPWDRPSMRLFVGQPETAYPTDLIDVFFQALRVATGVDTGYAQLFAIPEGWANTYILDLPPLELGPVVRRYPRHFDDYGWNVEGRKAVSGEEIAETGTIMSQLLSAPRQLRLAAARISSAMLEPHVEDAVVDSCIALEAMLGDGDRGETTHKIALRGAAVSALAEDPFRPELVFDLIKQAYGFRSHIVHGRDPATSKKRTWSDGEHTIGTADVAVILCRDILRVLLARPDKAKPRDIDRSLLAGLAGPLPK